MSLSRPVNFPLLKLPWLCIKCVLHNSVMTDIIYFATISKRARRIVKSSNYPLKQIDVYPTSSRKICMGNCRTWHFKHDKYGYGVPLVLQRDSLPFMTSRLYESINAHSLLSKTAGDILDALKMGIDFLIDVFGCSVRQIHVCGNKLSDLFGLGISSVEVLFITEPAVNLADLKYLLETIKVTDNYAFYAPIPGNFSCDPQIFKCRMLSFGCNHSADWVTLDLLCQLNVPQLSFSYHRFSAEKTVSYITHWFNSENIKLEYVQFYFMNPLSQEDFKIDHLNPMPFCEKRRNRCPLNVKGWEAMDISSGKDILRHDGLLATLYASSTSIVFYVWHKRFPDAV